jgi:hypothetical protein
VSIKVMNLVWGSTVEGPTKRFALLALADRASDQGECSALGVPTLCRKTGIKRSTMFGLLRDLELVDNLIQREEQSRANGSRKASRFWINLPLLTTMQRAAADDRDADEPANPFGVSAVQTPVQDLDGTPAEAIHTPVQDLDPLPVQILDGVRPDLGPLDPFSSSDTEKTPETDGRIGSPSEHQHLAARIVAGLDLRRCGPSPKQRGQITDAVAAALARGVAAPVVAEYARRKAVEADTVKYLVKAFAEEHLPTGVVPVVPVSALSPVCGQCDARDGDPVSARVVWLDAERTQSTRCPRCHPRATGGAR